MPIQNLKKNIRIHLRSGIQADTQNLNYLALATVVLWKKRKAVGPNFALIVKVIIFFINNAFYLNWKTLFVLCTYVYQFSSCHPLPVSQRHCFSKNPTVFSELVQMRWRIEKIRNNACLISGNMVKQFCDKYFVEFHLVLESP